MSESTTLEERWVPNAGPQTAFFECAADELLYGGAAGGGKTDALLVEPLRSVHLPGWNGLILRRTMAELRKAGGLIERAWKMYPSVGGRPSDGGLSWRWPDGGRVDFGGIDHVHDVHKYQGSEYHYIGFDELTSFEESQYRYMQSRLRPTLGYRTYLRATSNPGGVFGDWVLAHFAPWLRADDPDYRGPTARPGKLLWYTFDTRADALTLCQRGTPGAKSRTFIPASFRDTPQVAAEYKANLDQLDPLTRAQLRDGNWLAVAAPGVLFKPWYWTREKGTLVPPRPCNPRDVVNIIRAWDLAATEVIKVEGQEPKQAATCGARLWRMRDGRTIIDDVVRVWAGPGEVEELIEATADQDKASLLWTGHTPTTVLPQDPAQAGKAQRHQFARRLRHHSVKFVNQAGADLKVQRAKPYAAAAENGLVVLEEGEWVAAFIREHAAFPGRALKDQVDAASLGYAQLELAGVVVPARDKTAGYKPKRETARGTGGF